MFTSRRLLSAPCSFSSSFPSKNILYRVSSERGLASESVLSPLFQAALSDNANKQIKKDGENGSSSDPENIVKNAINNKGHSGAALQPRPSRLLFSTGEMRVSQKKLNHLARLMRGMTINQAQSQMRMTLKKRGKDVSAMLHRSACALVHNWGFNAKTVRDDTIVKEAWIGKGVFLKRIRIHGRGRTGKMTRPYAHLKVILEEKSKCIPSLSLKEQEIDPLTGNPFTKERVKEKQEEFAKLVKIFKRDRLFLTMQDSKPIYPGNTPWTTKGWKYITSPKWINPENALMKSKRSPRKPKID